MRLRFWTWVHDSLEKAWHWVYYHKVRPLQPSTPIIPTNVLYSCGFDVPEGATITGIRFDLESGIGQSLTEKIVNDEHFGE